MMPDLMQVSAVLKQAEMSLEKAGKTDARRIARLIMMQTLTTDSAGLLSREEKHLSPDQMQTFDELIGRATTEPVHRILGYREFHGLELNLHADTLEPRDDTESLVNVVLSHLAGRVDQSMRFADLGTGTGAIALALLHELPKATAMMTDIADGAIETASNNASNHGLDARCQFVNGSWLEPLTGKFDFIVSNPPYIASNVVETLDPMVRDYDPRIALDGGEDGLDAYRIILRDAASYLEPNGFLALEIGYDQAESVKKLARQHGWTFKNLAQDLGGNDRAMIFTL